MLSEENKTWLERYSAKYGRSPKVLHIGNIANNAYNNAKILTEAGLDNDVICYDYYHIMACPEWEDGDFEGGWGNDFFPDWAALDIKEFERPKWFAQGRLQDCIQYLIAKRLNSTAEQTKILWHRLGRANRTVSTLILPKMAPRLRRLYRLAQLVYGIVSNLLVRFYFVRRFGFLLEHQLIGNKKRKLINKDIVPYLYYINRWKELLDGYDIVIGYSTDPFIPLMAGVPYFAFEHGTLRDIPFADDAQGRRTNLAYQLAQHVFVTNFDCLNNAQKLAPGKHTIINHPFDEDHGDVISGHFELRIELQQKLSSEYLFFFPTRHDWVPGTGYADKANDVFLNAFIDMRRSGLKVGMVCCEWGANVAQSKELIDAQNMNAYVLWIKPLAIVGFERMAKACDIVVDQFKLGAFGGILFKAMAVGSPVLTYLDELKVLEQYSEMPPAINCATHEEILEKASRVLGDAELLDDLADQSRAWVKKYHSKGSTVNKQVDQFRIFLTKQDMKAAT